MAAGLVAVVAGRQLSSAPSATAALHAVEAAMLPHRQKPESLGLRFRRLAVRSYPLTRLLRVATTSVGGYGKRAPDARLPISSGS